MYAGRDAAGDPAAQPPIFRRLGPGNILDDRRRLEARHLRQRGVRDHYGRFPDTLRDNPISYQELFHPEDRLRVLTRLEEAAETGQINEEFRIIRPDRAVRWMSVHVSVQRSDAQGIIEFAPAAHKDGRKELR